MTRVLEQVYTNVLIDKYNRLIESHVTDLNNSNFKIHHRKNLEYFIKVNRKLLRELTI